MSDQNRRHDSATLNDPRSENGIAVRKQIRSNSAVSQTSRTADISPDTNIESPKLCEMQCIHFAKCIPLRQRPRQEVCGSNDQPRASQLLESFYSLAISASRYRSSKTGTRLGNLEHAKPSRQVALKTHIFVDHLKDLVKSRVQLIAGSNDGVALMLRAGAVTNGLSMVPRLSHTYSRSRDLSGKGASESSPICLSACGA
jgi:hypothetical protein